MLRFDVYGRTLGVVERAPGWACYWLGSEGTRREARDVVIPAHVERGELAAFLSDHFHESSTPDRPVVLELP